MRPMTMLLSLLAACKDVEEPTEVPENEVITTVVLTFTPGGGGAPIEARWADPENDGDPVIDPITLSDAEDYTLDVEFLNELESPAEDITAEVEAEGDEHQVFFTGTAVGGVVEVEYADADANGDPVGLANDVVTVAPGSGTFTVTLRHLPPQDGTPVKTGDLADTVASDGIDAIPGDSDVDVSFDLTVQ